METQVVDDVHLSSPTARMIRVITRNVKGKFIRVQAPANGSESASRDHSRQQSPHPPEHAQRYTPSIEQNAMYSSAPSYQYNIDPLRDIRARPMADFSTRTFMPPPNFNFETNDFDVSLDLPQNMDDAVPAFSNDWLALPLDDLFHNAAANVDQGFGGIGPTIGERDMLEVLTNQQYREPGWTNFNPDLMSGFQ